MAFARHKISTLLRKALPLLAVACGVHALNASELAIPVNPTLLTQILADPEETTDLTEPELEAEANVEAEAEVEDTEYMIASQIANIPPEELISAEMPDYDDDNNGYLSTISLSGGDVVGHYTRGNQLNFKGEIDDGGDSRRWFDAKLPIIGDRNSQFQLYGAATMGWDTSDDFKMTSVRDHLSLGAGFGFSYTIDKHKVLRFDFRHADPQGYNTDSKTLDSVGFSLYINF
ncbi:MAG: hypothetical protein LUD39_01940 [Opitutae bacterium]|nr:hypothetical protein [Opitutae bacterium]